MASTTRPALVECDGQDCRVTAIMFCDCGKCRQESEKLYSCFKHEYEIRIRHLRLWGWQVQWKMLA